MSYQMMVLTHVVYKKSYCTGNTLFLQAKSREELFTIITDPNLHGDDTSTFNKFFRPLFGKNPNEVAFVLFEGDIKENVENTAREFAIGRVCNNLTKAQANTSQQCPINSPLKPVLIKV
ncbi:hypothetical protein CAG70_05345 [Photobacterium halotolerans]|uniref:hypothetical protein n=1 Tax=Photobacterium halotolerans TaxID=265726 RepID=UPI001372A8F8|nr:hypothetical protein [Photobacterium halotolerans]NAX46422.1 hypothetical protein [Photobacterium halotolerans]